MNKKNKGSGANVKYSIRAKLTCIMVICISSVVLLCWIVNKTFLSTYYEDSKVKLLGDTYDYINKTFQDYDGSGEIDEQVSSQIERICSVSNVTVYVYDYNSNIINIQNKTGVNYIYPERVSRDERDSSFFKLLKYLPDEAKQEYFEQFDEKKSKDRTSEKKEDISDVSEKGDKIFDVISNDLSIENQDHIKTTDNYSVYKVYDSRIKSYDIELAGVLDSGLYVYVSSNFDSIKESVDISNKFLSYIGIGVTIVGFFVMLLVSKSFSQPILDLAAIAKKMSNLDFDAKYEVTTEDEIAQLGANMNFLSDTLEKTIAELKSANIELENDIKDKIQIDEMRKEFLSNISHELKTPIALIQGYAEGLKEDITDDPESREYYLDVIIDEANKMNDMVKKLLDLNHIEFGDSAINIERFDIVELINNIITNADILVKQKHAVVTMKDYKPLYVWADEYMIEEVFTNYFSNALNHIDGDRNIIITIDESDDLVRISVYNDGENIPDEELDKVWIKFYKVDKARTREYGGSGVGLSIVKAIMDAHNKKYGVENKPNGVSFWFEIDKSVR